MATSEIPRESFTDILAILDGKYAERVKVSDIALKGDEEIIRTWPDIPEGKVSQCIDFLNRYVDVKNQREQKYVIDPQVGRETISGVYRIVSNDVSRLATGLKGVIQTLRKGFAETLTWSEARIVEQKDSEHIIVEFPNCSASKVDAIIAEISSTYATVEVRGQTITGPFTKTFATGKEADDGSATITVFLANEQLTATSYADYDTDKGQDIYYFWRVPKSAASAILTAYRETGATATMSFNDAMETYDITIRKKAATSPPNLTTGNIYKHCDTTVVYHFAWGYTKAQLETFLNNHAGSEAAGITRTVRVDTRGDGLYDATVQEETVTYSAAKHQLDWALFSGPASGGITIRTIFGWNTPVTELATVKTLLEADAQNQKSDFKVTRNDNCTFDYVAVLETHTEQTATATVTQESADAGIGIVVEEKDKLASVPAAVSAGRRVRKNIDVKQNDLGSYRYRIETVTVAKRTGDTSAFGGNRLIYFGINTDEVLEGVTLGNKKIIGGSINGKDDGSLEYNLIVRDLDNPVEGNTVYGNKGMSITEDLVVGGNPENIPEMSAEIQGETRIIDARLDEDGSASWSDKIQTSGVLESVSGGEKTDRQGTTVTIQKNAREEATLSSLLPNGTKEIVRNDPNPDETWNTEKIVMTAVEANSEEVVYYNDGIVKKSMQYYFNMETKPTDAAASSERTEVVGLEYNDFGRYNYGIKKVTLLVSRLARESFAQANIKIDNVKSLITGVRFSNGEIEFTATPALYAYDRRMFQTGIGTITRKYYITPTGAGSSTTNVTLASGAYTAEKKSVGYDEQREVWFVDEQSTAYSAITDLDPALKVRTDSALGS